MDDQLPTKDKASLRVRVLETERRKPLFLVICFLVGALAVPMLLVFLIKSPQPDQHIVIFGISYYKLVFVFLLSAALVVHTSLFFLRAKPVTILVTFVLSLFCCFPFIVGLRNNLTLHQAIMDISFFENWPFFLRPAYVMIEFLIPAGILIYLFLQIKSIFSKKSSSYVFLGAAVYLMVAASLGFSALIQTEEPNILTALVRKRPDLVEKDGDAVLPRTSPQGFSAGKDNIESARSSGLPIPQVPNHPESESAVSRTRLPPAAKNPAPNKIAMVELEQRVQALSGKVDRIMVELGQMKTLIMERQESLQEEKADAAVQEKGSPESSPTIVKKEAPADSTAIGDLQQEVRLVTEKINRVLDTLGQMAKPLLQSQEKVQEDEDTVEEEETHKAQ